MSNQQLSTKAGQLQLDTRRDSYQYGLEKRTLELSKGWQADRALPAEPPGWRNRQRSPKPLGPVPPARSAPLCTTFAKAGRVCLAGFAALLALQRGSALRQHSGIDPKMAGPA